MRGRIIQVVFPLLIATLLIALISLWVDREGRVRGVHWVRPTPMLLDVAGMVPTLPERIAEQGGVLETLERPLFSPSRRPPPPPPPSSPPADAVMPLTGVHVYGLYGVDRNGGAILGVDGKSQRVKVNDTIKGWKLVSIGDRSLDFVRGGRQQVLELVHAIPKPSATGPTPVQLPQPSVNQPAAVVSSPESPVAGASREPTAESSPAATSQGPKPRPRFGGVQTK